MISVIKKYAAACVLAVIFFYAPELYAAPSSYYTGDGNYVVWYAEGKPVWKFPAANAKDVSKLSEMFNRLYKIGFQLKDLRVDKANGRWTLFIGKTPIYSVDPEYARSTKQDQKSIALQIMSRLYGALGERHAADLTPAYQIRGRYDLSASVSWYGGKFVGRKFANGERFTETHLTAAAKSLPFGTLVKVTAPSGKFAVVRVTDRFRETKNRVLDISHAAADLLGIKNKGVAPARIEVIGRVDGVGGK
ncbi:MAG: septal ring lytic transglycosylase RlpA family protein [Synergistaceae bacterium]|nr:septal ring lytic transglycosylase RlpA family protein [Synergistaceae bacterium]